MTTITSLIERTEAATEGSRELDRDICVALGWHQVETNVGRDWRDPQGYSRLIPHFSTSIDAALTLLPEGYDWIIGNVNGHYGGTPYACVGSTEQHYAATPCLALLAAILRARQTEARG